MSIPSLVGQVFRRQLRAAPRPSGLPASLHGRLDEHALAYPPSDSAVRRLRRSGLGLAVLCATAFSAVRIDHYVLDHRLLAAARSVNVVAAKPVSATEHLILPGETAAWHQSTVYARVDGSVAKWFVDIGDKVRQGEVLCLLETPAIDAQLAAARAELRASQAQVAIQQADADFARSTYERWRDSPQGVVSDQERMTKRAEYARAAARLDAARAQVAIDQERVDRYAALSALKQVTAPLGGVITGRDIDIGRAVTAAGTGSPTPLYRLIEDDPIRVFVEAPQSIASSLMRPGVPAQVLVNEGSGIRRYDGTIARTAAALDDRTRTLRVEVDLPNPRHELLSGMSARVAFDVAPRGSVEVPAAAVLWRAGAAQVAGVDSSDRVRFHEVTVARNDGDVVELSSGVHPGDLVILSAGRSLADGDRVKVSRATSRTAGALLTLTVRR